MSYDFTNVSWERLHEVYYDYIDFPQFQREHPHYWKALQAEHTRRIETGVYQRKGL